MRKLSNGSCVTKFSLLWARLMEGNIGGILERKACSSSRNMRRMYVSENSSESPSIRQTGQVALPLSPIHTFGLTKTWITLPLT
jgi:hypothetical protein